MSEAHERPEMNSAPLLIGTQVRLDLDRIARRAVLFPVNITELARKLDTEQGKRKYMAQMTMQSVIIDGPHPFLVTFSIETGHPAGTCRHMSMSLKRHGRTPSPIALTMVAALLGFEGEDLETMPSSRMWFQDTSEGFKAVHLVQPCRLHLVQTGRPASENKP